MMAFFTLTSFMLYLMNASYPRSAMSENFWMRSSASGSNSSLYSLTPSTSSAATFLRRPSDCSWVCRRTSGLLLIASIWSRMVSSPMTAWTASPSARRRTASFAAACM